MAELVRLAIADDVATITLDSQHNRNALSRQLLSELSAAITDAEDAAVRAIVLGHEGPAFCAGADLKERASAPGAPDSRPMVAVMERLMDTSRPTIAAVQGAVRAGGIGLMASCDLVVVDRSVTFALTEVRIGVAAAIISVPILRRVPPGKIAAAMLTGEVFDADEARDIGLVTHVTDDVPATVGVLCDGIRAGAPRAVAETKRILDRVANVDRSIAFDEMRALSDELFAGPDAAEGMAAFREKRSPIWPA
jgi:enoyl-CoA hydratase/carnithine racemase